jgi:hypothetical protein
MFTHFRHDLLQKYGLAFGSLFANIIVTRPTSANTTAQQIRVPIAYAQKSKVFVRLASAPDANTLTGQIRMTAPCMSYERVALVYDPTRKLQTTRQHRVVGANDWTGRKLFNPVPYKITYALNIFATTYTDADQIIEQIVPFFTPSYTLRLEALSELGVEHDLPITLESTSVDDTAQGTFEESRTITWTLTFVLNGFLYGPASSGALIRDVQVDTHIIGANTPAMIALRTEDNELMRSEDGGRLFLEQTANTSSTPPRVMRVRVTPSPVDAAPSDDFDYITEVTYYEDGAVFNPVTLSDETVT